MQVLGLAAQLGCTGAFARTAWAFDPEPGRGRSEAIRRLVELGLKGKR